MAERREAERVDVHLTARYNSEAVTLSGHVANLSRHGLFLRSDFLDTAGARANLDVNLPGEPGAISLSGEVVRVVDRAGVSGMGIRFRKIDSQDLRKLANYMIERSVHAIR